MRLSEFKQKKGSDCMDYPFRHGSLESGLGGFDYAADQIGWENIFHVEINKFCQTILKYYWPNAKSFTDIFEFDGTAWRGKVDIITAGFPCQPFSHAGKRKGSTDDRHIWPENLRIIREAQPKYVVLENVAGLLTILQPDSISKVESKALQLFGEGYDNGAIRKTIESIERRIIGTIIEDLKAAGYILPTLADGTPIILCIPACAKDAVHRRDRIWIVAYNSSLRCNTRGAEQSLSGISTINEKRFAPNITSQRCGETGQHFQRQEERTPRPASHNSEQGLAQPGQAGERQLSTQNGTRLHDRPELSDRDAADTSRQRLQGSERAKSSGQRQRTPRPTAKCDQDESWLEAAARLCSVDDGLAGRLDITAISKSKWRTESLKSYGNAIYWPIAYELFKAIEEYDNQKAIKPS